MKSTLSRQLLDAENFQYKSIQVIVMITPATSTPNDSGLCLGA